MKSSQAAVDLIVAEEVSSKETYIARYQHPEWPGGASGVTVGIGYDLGYATAERILSDWKDYLEPKMLQAMTSVAGLTGQAAHNALAGVRASIVVPWDAAMAVFKKVDMPRWEAIVAKAIPNADALPAGCYGVVTSVAYNRGASFSKDGDRYREMRSMREHIMSGDFSLVPADLRSMKRLWPNMAGLRNRREHEAVLWERSLAAFVPGTDQGHVRVDTGDDRGDAPVTPEGNTVRPRRGASDPHIEDIQKELAAMGYYEVGTVEGIAGGKLFGGIAAFMNDRGLPPVGVVSPQFEAELQKAIAEHWHRPISDARKNAQVKDLPKLEVLVQQWWQKFWAVIVGAPAFLTAGFKGVFGDQNDPTSMISSVKNFFGAIPSEYYWLAIGGVAVAIYVQARKAQNATLAAYQQGKIN